MRGERVRWVLAFDSGCARCQALASSVRAACQGGLEVLPLDHDDVQRWAGQAQPDRPMTWAPTLFRVRGTAVRLWTGRALSARLMLHLGPMATLRVLRAIGAVETRPPAPAVPVADSTTRRRFLELAAGAALAGGILITGAIPVAADPVASWLKNNRQQLPRTYPELAALPPEYRSAVYQELTPAERSAAWVAHLTQHRAPTLTAEQSAVIGAALAFAANHDNFAKGPAAPAAAAIAGRATKVFGVETAGTIFATLGPGSMTTAAATVSCQCSTVSNYCGRRCLQGGCTPRSPGCGFLYQYACNGRCG